MISQDNNPSQPSPCAGALLPSTRLADAVAAELAAVDALLAVRGLSHDNPHHANAMWILVKCNRVRHEAEAVATLDRPLTTRPAVDFDAPIEAVDVNRTRRIDRVDLGIGVDEAFVPVNRGREGA